MEEDDKSSKLICEDVAPFEQTKKELWIQFDSIEAFQKEENTLYKHLSYSNGEEEVVIYCKQEKQMKRLPRSKRVDLSSAVLSNLMNCYGSDFVKVIEKPIEKIF